MAEYQFRFVEYDFNRGGAGSQEPQAGEMRKMTRDGWEMVNSNLAFPLASVLWRREVEPPPPPQPAKQAAPAKAAAPAPAPAPATPKAAAPPADGKS